MRHFVLAVLATTIAVTPAFAGPVHVFGPGGPAPAMKEAAATFSKMRGVPVEVTVQVKRPASTGDPLFKANAGFNIEYDSSKGQASTPWQNVEPGEGWATYTYAIPDATFSNGEGYDLMINAGGSKTDLTFSSISVRRGAEVPVNNVS